MFTTKEATTTIRMGKLTFQDFNFYFFGDTVTKKGCIFLVMNIFIGDLIRDNKTAGWFIVYYFLNMYTVHMFIRGIIVYSDFFLAISSFFTCDVLDICIWRASGTYCDLDLIHLVFFHSTLREKCPNTKSCLVSIFLYSDYKKILIGTLFSQWQSWFALKEILGVSAELWGWFFKLSNRWWSWSIYNNSLKIKSWLILLRIFIACCSRLSSFLFSFINSFKQTCYLLVL